MIIRFDNKSDIPTVRSTRHLNIKLNQKIIKEMCGTVSFKRGEAFYRANKVRFEQYQFRSIVKQRLQEMEDFHVTIEKDARRWIFERNAAVRQLASFQKDCQHIAAVLLAIYEHQRQGTNPIVHATSVNSRQIRN